MVSASPNKPDRGRIGIIAGKGDLPVSLAGKLKEQGEDPFLLLVEGEADPGDYTGFPLEEIPITKIGRFLKILERENCKRVTMVGPVARPDFKNILPDLEGLKLLGRIGKTISKGDDGLLREISAYIEEKGFKIVGAHELTGDLVADVGTLGRLKPEEADWLDIYKGREVVRALGAFDIGQAVVVRDEYVLGVEAAEGTESLISRCADMKREYPAGILVKLPKPGQDLRADMPTIGPDTIRQVSAANLKGIVIQAGACIIVDAGEVIRLADQAEVFLHSLEVVNEAGGY